MEIVQGQGSDLTDAQTIRGNQQEHRVVTDPDGRPLIDRRQERLDGLPGEGAGELLQAIQPWGVQGGVQPGGTLAIGGRKAEKTAQVGHEVLLGAAPQLRGAPTHEGLDLAGLQTLKARRVPVVRESVEQCSHALPVHLDGMRGQPPEVGQLLRVGAEEPLARRGGRRQQRAQDPGRLQVAGQRVDQRPEHGAAARQVPLAGLQHRGIQFSHVLDTVMLEPVLDMA
jgi:hypothetical protein